MSRGTVGLFLGAALPKEMLNPVCREAERTPHVPSEWEALVMAVQVTAALAQPRCCFVHVQQGVWGAGAVNRARAVALISSRSPSSLGSSSGESRRADTRMGSRSGLIRSAPVRTMPRLALGTLFLSMFSSRTVFSLAPARKPCRNANSALSRTRRDMPSGTPVSKSEPPGAGEPLESERGRECRT